MNRLLFRFAWLLVAWLSLAPFPSSAQANCYQTYSTSWDYTRPVIGIGNKVEIPDGVYFAPQLLSITRRPFEDKFAREKAGIVSNTQLSLEQKVTLVRSAAASLRCKFFEKRFDEYRSWVEKVSLRHGCTRTSNTTGTRRCPGSEICTSNTQPALKAISKFIYRGNDVDWNTLATGSSGTYIDAPLERVSNDGRSFCAHDLRKSSVGAIRDIMFVHFQMQTSQAYSLALVEAESMELNVVVS